MTNLILMINGIFREEMKAMPVQDSYFVFNTAIRYTFDSDVSLQFNIKNLFDEDYKTHTFAPIPDNALANRGRTFNLELRSEF